MSWYEGPGASRLDHDREIVASRPELVLDFVITPNGRMTLVGTVTVTLPSRVAYPIGTRVEFPRNYPRSEPRAFEASGRFKHTADRHFYGNGQACLWLDEFESKWRPDDPDALGTFLDELLAFYLRQLVFDANPSAGYPGPWRGHGDVGLVEHLEEVINLPAEALPRMWRAIAGGVYRNAPCPCGRRFRYRKCHRNRVRAFREHLSQDAIDDVTMRLRRWSVLRVPAALRGRRPVRR